VAKIKIAIVGSRGIYLEDFQLYLPENTTEILSGGAKGIDTCAKKFALEHQIPFTEYLPEYQRYGRVAPIKRNDIIVNQADYVLIFWDGISRGTQYVIEKCKKQGKMYQVIRFGAEPKNEWE
jgi:predicted Rossmann fold nucleotide-binding protein DprA/Smf involved in DNA uptake